MTVGVVAKAEHGERLPLRLVEPRGRSRLADVAETGGDRVQRIGEVAPARRRIGTERGEGAARPLPCSDRRLGAADLVRAHALEEIIPGIVLAHMVEAQEAPAPRTVEIGRLLRRFELAGSPAARDCALRPRPLDPAMHSCGFRCHASSPTEPLYIGPMNAL